MSNLSIYETRWINLVFENRNQDYGAYQLRKDYSKIALTAFFSGLILVAFLGLLSKINWFGTKSSPIENITPFILKTPIEVSEVYIHEVKQKQLASKQTERNVNQIETPVFKNPVVVSNFDLKDDEPIKNTALNQTSTSSDNLRTSDGKPDNFNSGGTDEAATGNTKDYGNEIVGTKSLDKLPEFPGGMEKFYSYVGNNFEKPYLENQETVKIIVHFIIEKDGSMSSIEVKNKTEAGFDAEAIRVLKSIKTKWKPGIVNSQPVRTSYSLPIIIQIE